MRIIARSKIVEYCTLRPDSIGNHHRLIAVVKFTIKTVFIRFRRKKLIAMTHIKSETAYNAAMDRIEELLPPVQGNTPPYDRNLIELDLLSGLVEEYEEEHYPIKTPILIEAIKLRMYEMGLNQTKLSELLGVSTSRVSDYLNGRCEPTQKAARGISRKLNIDADIVLGV